MAITGFTSGPMAPAAAYEIIRQKEGKGEYGYFTGKNQITVAKTGDKGYKKTNSNNVISGKKNDDKVNVNVKTDTRGVELLDIGGAIFPPLGLLNIGRDPIGTQRPVFDISGSPAAMAQYEQMGGGPAFENKPDDGLGGALSSIGSGLSIAGALIPIGLGIMLLSQIKGLFK